MQSAGPVAARGLESAFRRRGQIMGEIGRLMDQNAYPFSLILADLDDFKTVNDLFGHMAGDRPLQAAAPHIASSVRGTDLVARYGGDEFLVVLADTDGAEAQGVAERVRGALAGGRLALGTGAELVPTLSAGGIEAQVGQSVDDLMPAADHPPRATAPATPASTCRRRRSSRRRRFGQRPTRGRRSRTRR